MKKLIVIISLIFCQPGWLSAQQKSALMSTPWTDKVDEDNPLNYYPRPNMMRDQWQNLNGQWEYAIRSKADGEPRQWDGQLLVPFPIESYLSGVRKRVGKNDALWYKRTFYVSENKPNTRVILHFGAIDYESQIFLNGKKVAFNRGGYKAFSVDVTPYLKGGKEVLLVKVIDPTDQGKQPRGKQVTAPGGIYYTPVTGIWQTVWYEVVPETFIKSYKVTADVASSTVHIAPEVYNGYGGDRYKIMVSLDDQPVVEKSFDFNDKIELSIPDAQLWSPDSPTLYDLQISVIRADSVIDEVKGYFGMRSITMAKDDKGINRMFLNGQALFQYGPLDQGYWPDGIYTAPTEEALVSDIKRMKDMGFNMVRKHVKVEPARWYYHCDRLGLLVWQDMPSGFGEIVPVKDHDYSIQGDWLATHYEDVNRTYESERDFRSELQAIVDQHYNSPSIVVWVPFNESWGQFKTNEILDWTKALDSTRLVDGPSGWIDRGEGDIRDYHLYGDRFYKDFPLEDNRALVIGEFGGLGYAVEDHLYSKDAWSYQGFKNSKALRKAYEKLIERVVILKNEGFSAAVYTQLTDVETEINGLITYDRKVIKIPSKKLKDIHEKLYK